MAKAKAEKKELTDLEKKYGEGAFVSAKDFLEQPREVIRVSPKLDMILGGGIPEGSFVILAGPPKIGKTVTSLHFAANAQKAGRNVYYLNIEGRLKPRDLQGIPGLDMEKAQIIGSYREEGEKDKSKIILAHEYLTIAERKIKDDPGCVVIVDSASQLLTETESDGELGQQHRAPGALLLSQFCKKISNVLPVTGSIVIMIVHVVANTGGGHKKTSRTGGNKIQYAVDVDLECKFTEKWIVGKKADDEDSGTQIGLKIHWITGSTGIAAPGMKTVSYLRFGAGIDEFAELVDMGKTLSLIGVSGSWFKANFLEDTKYQDDDELYDKKKKEFRSIQGEENFVQFLNGRPELVDILRDKVKEFTG